MAYIQNTSHIISWLYPDITPGSDFWLENFGELELTWNTTAHPKPTEAEILAQVPAYEAAVAAEEAERTQLEAIRDVLTAMRDGEGTAGERLSRVETVLFRVAKRLLDKGVLP